jgi:hypothetical protein
MFKRKGFNRKLKEGLKARRFHRINEEVDSEEGPRIAIIDPSSEEDVWFNLFDYDTKESLFADLSKIDPDFEFDDYTDDCSDFIPPSSDDIDDELFDLIREYKDLGSSFNGDWDRFFELNSDYEYNDHGLDREDFFRLASDHDLDDLFMVVSGNDYDIGAQYIDEIYGSLSELSKDTLERYFDYEAFGRDIRIESSYEDINGTLYFFSR